MGADERRRAAHSAVWSLLGPVARGSMVLLLLYLLGTSDLHRKIFEKAKLIYVYHCKCEGQEMLKTYG